MTVTIESLRPGDAERRWEIGRQAFGATAPYDADAPAAPGDQIVGAYDGDTLLGSVVVLDFAMTWGGLPVSCGGVAGVIVVPEARGRNLARRMLDEAFDRMAARGQPISALYPTTATLYRSVGYDVVGWFGRRRVPLSTIPVEPARMLDWRRVALDDPIVFDLHTAMAADHDGWFRPDPWWWASRVHRAIAETSVNRYAYVGARDGDDVAVVQFRYTTSDTAIHGMEAEVLAGRDGDAVAAALGFLAGHGTTVDEVETTLPLSVLDVHVPHVQRTTSAMDWPWMLRLVDIGAAFSARGWPSAVSGGVDLDVVDPVRGDNQGPHRFEISAGRGSLTPGGTGRVAVSVQDLARLYAGRDPRTLHVAGRLVGATTADLDVLAAACVSSPTAPFFF